MLAFLESLLFQGLVFVGFSKLLAGLGVLLDLITL